jgi:hypothetical protein
MRDRRSNSPPLRQAQGRLSRRRREKDGAAPPILLAKGWASPLSRRKRDKDEATPPIFVAKGWASPPADRLEQSVMASWAA